MQVKDLVNQYYNNLSAGSTVATKTKGVEQLGNFKLGEVVPAATFAASRNVAVTNKQTLVSVKDGSYICLKGVEFTGKESQFTAQCAGDSKSIKVMIDGFGSNGKEIGAKFSGVSGVHDLYIILQEGVELINWSIK